MTEINKIKLDTECVGRKWNRWNSHTLLVQMQDGTTKLENWPTV